MHAYVYKSQRKQDTFVYLATRDDFSVIPADVQARLAPFAFVLDVALTPERRLAQADADTVRAALASDKPTVMALREIAARRIDNALIDEVEKAERERAEREALEWAAAEVVADEDMSKNDD